MILISLTACISNQSIKEIRGHVIHVESNSLTIVSEIHIKDKNKKIFILKPQIYKGFTPSHLRHHQIVNEPITIKYILNNGILTIISMDD